MRLYHTTAAGVASVGTELRPIQASQQHTGVLLEPVARLPSRAGQELLKEAMSTEFGFPAILSTRAMSTLDLRY